MVKTIHWCEVTLQISICHVPCQVLGYKDLLWNSDFSGILTQVEEGGIMKEKKNISFCSKKKEKRKKERKHSANWPVSKSSHHISQTKSFSSRTLPVNYSTEPFFFSTMECFVYSVDARNILKMTLVFSNYISSGYTLPHQRQGMLWTLA